MSWRDEERLREELRVARRELRTAMELGRRTAVHALLFGYALGAVWMWLLWRAWQ